MNDSSQMQPSQVDSGGAGRDEVRAQPIPRSSSPRFADLWTWRELGAYAISLLVTVAVFYGIIDHEALWDRLPFIYRGDGLFTMVFFKGIMENGWYLTNPAMGFPDGMQLHDFPMADSFSFLMVRLISLVAHNIGRVVDVYYFCSYLMITTSAMFALRRLGVSRPGAIVFSNLFCFLPYHLMRLPHLLLSNYFIIPLYTLLAAWIYLNEPLFFAPAPSAAIPGAGGSGGASGGRVFLKARTLLVAAICIVGGCSGIYYSFFACYFFLVAGIVGGWHLKSFAPVSRAAAVIAIVTVVSIANIIPNLLYYQSHGLNPQALVRAPYDSEFYALKLDMLVLPVPNHRIPLLAALRQRYHDYFSALINENDTSSLGAVASLGLVVLIGSFLFTRGRFSQYGLWHFFRTLTLFAVMLCTMGGLGALLSLLGFHYIRAYNRVSVFIGFFALTVVALALDHLHRRYAQSVRRDVVFVGALAGLLALGLADEIPRHVFSYVTPMSEQKAQFRSDRAFVQRIEAAVAVAPAPAPGAAIFQFPHIFFPEGPTIVEARPYDLARGYIHSHTLRWSFGATNGRPGETWQAKVYALPTPALLDTICVSGFDGIYIDRTGYDDRERGLESQFVALLHQQPMTSEDGRLSFFNIMDYARDLKNRHSPAEWEAMREAALAPLEAR